MRESKIMDFVLMTIERADQVCQMLGTKQLSAVSEAILSAGLEWINVPGMDEHVLAKVLGVNLNFAILMQQLAVKESERRLKKGIFFQCGFCTTRTTFKEELRRHNIGEHAGEESLVKREVKEEMPEVVVVDDEDEERPSKRRRLQPQQEQLIQRAPIAGGVFLYSCVNSEPCFSLSFLCSRPPSAASIPIG